MAGQQRGVQRISFVSATAGPELELPFEIQSRVPGVSCVPINSANTSEEMRAIFARARQRGISIAVTRLEEDSGVRTVTFQLYRSSASGAPLAVGQAMSLSHMVGGENVNGRPQWLDSYITERNRMLSTMLRDQLTGSADERQPEIRLPQSRVQPRPSIEGQRPATPAPVQGALDFTNMPQMTALNSDMREAGFELRVVPTPRGGSAYQLFQLNVYDHNRPNQTSRAVGLPFTLWRNDYDDPARRDTALAREVNHRLAASDFGWRNETIRFLRGLSADPLAITHLVSGSRDIPGDQLCRGQETRFGEVLVNLLAGQIGQPGVTITAPELAQLKMPLLHRLQQIEQSHPGYLESLESLERSSPGMLRRFVVSVAEQILEERRDQAGNTILAPGMQVVGFFNHERMFSERGLCDLASRFGVVDSAEQRRIFLLRGATNERQPHNVNTFLHWAGIVGGNHTQPTLMWLHGHGSPTSIEFSHGHGPNNCVDVHQLAEALIREQSGAVRLDHLRIAFDCCYGYDFGRNFLEALNTAAANQGKTIESFPLIISASHRGSVAFVSSPNGRPESHLMHMVNHASVTRPGTLTVGDFMRADNHSAARLTEQASGWHVQAMATSGELYTAHQDSALFGGTAVSTSRTIQRARLSMALHGITLPLPAGLAPPARRTVPLEISRLIPEQGRELYG